MLRNVAQTKCTVHAAMDYAHCHIASHGGWAGNPFAQILRLSPKVIAKVKLMARFTVPGTILQILPEQHASGPTLLRLLALPMA